MGNPADLISTSKFLSYVLRHHPESIGLSLDKNGWASVDQLVRKARQDGRELDLSLIRKIMQTGDKQRFILSDDEQYIRAGYGHSIDIELPLKPKQPPKVLYHGTAKRNVSSIIEKGIRPGNRKFVHLSAKKDDARDVGSRHGKPVILTVEAGKMEKEGYDFFQSDSEPGIWLTKKVPPEFVIRP